MANLHSDLHSMANLCPTVDLWPTWTFLPGSIGHSSCQWCWGCCRGVPAPCLPPAPFAGSVPGFLSSHVQNVPIPRASQAVPWPHPTPAPCHWLGLQDGGEMWTFIRAIFLWGFFFLSFSAWLLITGLNLQPWERKGRDGRVPGGRRGEPTEASVGLDPGWGQGWGGVCPGCAPRGCRAPGGAETPRATRRQLKQCLGALLLPGPTALLRPSTGGLECVEIHQEIKRKFP